MEKSKLVIGFVILVVIILGFVISNKQNNTESVEGIIVLTGETKEFTIEAFQFDFNPNKIEVNLGDRVIIKVTSTDVPHGFSIKEYGIKEYLNLGSEVTVDFIADKKGTFTFYCSVICGIRHGTMRGQLIVN